VHDPQGALAWLSSLPAGPDRDDGIGEAYRDWMRRDFRAASAWVDEIQKKGELEPWTEPAIAIFAKTNGLEKPAESLELVSRFSDKSLREATTIAVARIWLQNDADAATAWLDKNLPPELRARVGSQPERANLPREKPRKRGGKSEAQPEQPAAGGGSDAATLPN
jgi:hypothetical protein